jgi:peptide/nickel transport system ATP-binding protein
MTDSALLSVRELSVQFPTEDGIVYAVNELSLDVYPGRTLGVVGESGCGKSVAAQAVLGLFTGTKAQVMGSVVLEGRELVGAEETDLRDLRGRRMAMIFQDPLSAMHPFFTVGNQIAEAYLVHNHVSKRQAREHTVEMLDRVGIANPRHRYDDYPHQFSGGMRQRAMIAMALVCGPALLIADEPTTALDVVVQSQILDLMREVQRTFGTAILLITHDLGVVAEMCDEVAVVYGGRCVEYGAATTVFHEPEMPYTWGLMRSVPRLDQPRQNRLSPIPGTPPSPLDLPTGCAFHPRCGYRDHVVGDACTASKPALTPRASDGVVRCHMTQDTRHRTWQAEVSSRS